MTECPMRLALCGVPCACDGKNPSHRVRAIDCDLDEDCSCDVADD